MLQNFIFEMYKIWFQISVTQPWLRISVKLYTYRSRPDCNKNIKTLWLECFASKESISTFRFDVQGRILWPHGQTINAIQISTFAHSKDDFTILCFDEKIIDLFFLGHQTFLANCCGQILFTL